MPPSRPNPEVDRARATVRAILEALDAGRAPRGRKPLLDAARLLEEAGESGAAAEALLGVGLLELRRGKEERGLSSARSALRLARRAGCSQGVEAALSLLARLHLRLEDPERARSGAAEWRRRASERGDGAASAAAACTLASVEYRAGQPVQAFVVAEVASEQARAVGDHDLRAVAELLAGAALLRVGCVLTATDRFGAGLSALDEAGEAPERLAGRVRVLLARGHAWRCLDRGPAALRDLRLALRLARTAADPRCAVEALAALAGFECERAAGGERSREERAAALAARARRRCERLHDPALEQRVAVLLDGGAGGGAARAGATPVTVKAAAATLVTAARAADNLALVDACLREARRLAALPAGSPPFHADLSLPLLSD